MENKTNILEIDADDAKDINSFGEETCSLNYLDLKEQPWSIYQYLRKIDLGKIIIQPEFQRNFIWDSSRKSRFIESVLLNFPLPPIYLNQQQDGQLLIIDGLQRTNTLLEFYKNKSFLSDLSILSRLNNCKFSDLPPEYQANFEEKAFMSYILKPSTPMKVIYELFDRINTGGTPLNRQEVRNCIYIGKGTKLLKKLAGKDIFSKAIDNGVSSVRLKDQEIILRYIAFRWFDFVKDYNGNLSAYIEECLCQLNRFTDKELKKIEIDFERVMDWAFKIFGKDAFRIPTERGRGMINTAVFETISYFISKHDDDFLQQNKKELYDRYKNVLLKDEKYLKAVISTTSPVSSVETRFSQICLLESEVC